MKDGDIGLILLYDANGYIAGIQAGVSIVNCIVAKRQLFVYLL